MPPLARLARPLGIAPDGRRHAWGIALGTGLTQVGSLAARCSRLPGRWRGFPNQLHLHCADVRIPPRRRCISPGGRRSSSPEGSSSSPDGVAEVLEQHEGARLSAGVCGDVVERVRNGCIEFGGDRRSDSRLRSSATRSRSVATGTVAGSALTRRRNARSCSPASSANSAVLHRSHDRAVTRAPTPGLRRRALVATVVRVFECGGPPRGLPEFGVCASGRQGSHADGEPDGSSMTMVALRPRLTLTCSFRNALASMTITPAPMPPMGPS
jgi:hypothetical protein